MENLKELLDALELSYYRETGSIAHWGHGKYNVEFVNWLVARASKAEEAKATSNNRQSAPSRVDTCGACLNGPKKCYRAGMGCYEPK